MVLVKKINK